MPVHSINASVAKKVNRTNVLGWIRVHQPVARNSIAGQIGLNPSTVTNIVRELLKDGLVVEAGNDVSAGGRRPVLLALDQSRYAAVGIEIGDTRITALACDLCGAVLSRTRIDLDTSAAGKGEQALNIARVAARHLVDQLQSQKRQIIGAGIGMTGLVDRSRREAVFSPNLGLHHQMLGELFAQELDLPLYVDNDVRAMTRGEMRYGAGKGRESLICLHVGAGLGAGVVLRGQIYYGHSDSAGEIGHTVVNQEGPLCSCGHRGCLEMMAGGNALLRLVAGRIHAGETSSLAPILKGRAELTINAVCGAAEEGDEVARTSLDRTANYLGLGIAHAVNAFDPELVVVGGPMMQADSNYLEIARAAAMDCIYDSPERKVEIVAAVLGDDACSIGAATIVLDEFFSRGGVASALCGAS